MNLTLNIHTKHDWKTKLILVSLIIMVITLKSVTGAVRTRQLSDTRLLKLSNHELGCILNNLIDYDDHE